MSTILYITIIFVELVILVVLGAGFYRTWKTQYSPNQQIFLKGSLPKPLPNGLYKGSVTGYSGSWKGKKFEAGSSSGINLINNEEKYPFKTYVGKGIADKNLDVLKIDYDIPQNPFWLRFI